MCTNKPSLSLIVLALLALTKASCLPQIPTSQNDQLELHSRRAREYLTEQQPAKAIPELEAVVTLDPANVEARANLGVLLFFEGAFAKAVSQLRAAVELKPDLWKIRSLLGIAERRTGDDRSGRLDLEAAFPNIAEEKLRIEVGRDLIESYSSTGDLDKAAATIAILLKLQPTNPTLLYTSYRIHSEMAVEAMLGLALAGPESAQIHQAIAHELQRDRDLPGTIANLRKALALDPALPGIHFELAEALHASDDQRLRAESAEQYKLATETNPSDPKAAARMGDLNVEKGDLNAAETFYRSALKLQPGYFEAAIGLANVLSEKGQPEDAATMLEKVEASDPSNALVHFRLSAAYRKLSRPDDVRRELALYKKYKEERERLRTVYQQLRLITPQSETEK